MIGSVIAKAVQLFTGARARWVGCSPELRQRIYFANHTSNLDLVLIWACLPTDIRRSTQPAAASDYWQGNAVRRYLALHVFNATLIERKHVTRSNNPLDTLLKVLDEGRSIIIFPEGKRGPGPDMDHFKSGLYHLAKERPSVELVPVYIENLNRVLPKGEILPVPILCSVSFGAPLKLEAGDNKDTFLERARLAVLQLGSAA